MLSIAFNIFAGGVGAVNAASRIKDEIRGRDDEGHPVEDLGLRA